MEKNKTIYVIEDDAFFLDIISENIAENKNFTVSGFSTAEECLANFKSPDLVVLDYFLDKENPSAMNGLEALKKILQISPTTKIIMLSGQESLSTADELLNGGAHDYVIKDRDAIKTLQKKINKVFAIS